MLRAMSRVTLPTFAAALLGALLPAALWAAGLPCAPCAGLRLAAGVLPAPAEAAAADAPASAPPASGAAGATGATGATGAMGAAGAGTTSPAAFDLLRYLQAAHLPKDSPLFVAWEVTLPQLPSADPTAMTAATAPVTGLLPSLPPAGLAAPGATAAPSNAANAAAGAAGTPAPPAVLAIIAAATRTADDIAAAGATPWISLVFTTQAPVTAHLAHLEAELNAAAAIAAAVPRGTWLQVVWRPAPPNGDTAAAVAGGAATSGSAGSTGKTGSAMTAKAATGAGGRFAAADYAFVLKRAAVALTGAQAGLRVATEPLPADPAALTAFYGAEVAAYLDLVALDPSPSGPGGSGSSAGAPPASGAVAAAGGASTGLAAALRKVHDLDPGRPVALDALAYPDLPAGAVLAAAAGATAGGFDLALFRTPAVTAAQVNPLIVLAREFAGDLSYDPASAPAGAAEAWAFVRGKDLAVRVIATTQPGTAGGNFADLAAAGPGSAAAAGAPPAAASTTAVPTTTPLVLRFADPDLRRPTLFPFAAGPPPAAPTSQVTAPPQPALEVTLAAAPAVVVLGLDRPSAAERHGVAEKVEVASRHEITVEEILKRLQAFEDAQERRLDEYAAIDTTHLRFQPSADSESVVATLTGPLFWSRQTGGDWAWDTLLVNGVRWRGKTLPEIPLIQPEKAAALPLAILLSRDYSYRLRGSDKIDGREAWVVDFSPSGPAAKGGRLYRGTVWVDQATGARLRTRGVQVGLQGEVISNEETLYYSPIDAHGRPADWAPESFVMPLRLVAEQVLSILNQPTLVERETLLTDVQINPPDFATRRQTVESSDVTMVRDTDKGLQYLIKKGDGPRVVQEGFKQNQLFAVGGLFVDDSLSYPLPLAGINYFDFDFKHTGEQVNVFFAGLLLVASAANPRVAGSRYNLGADAFAIALPFTDNFYHQGHEVVDEEVQIRPATFDLKLGRPLGDFVNVGISYGLLDSVYSRNDDTSHDFVLPRNNLLQSLAGSLSFNRWGYTAAAHYSYNIRSSWRFWGLPGNPDFSPTDRDFSRYDLSISKNWYLPFFQKIAAELDYYGGNHLDRFSDYQFGFFGGTRIHGYRSDDVRAQSTYLTHLSYGFDFGTAFRLDALVDAAAATDRIDGLNHTFLAGTGLAGSLMGPWQTLVTLDVGLPVAGPDHGFVLYLVFLKLFH